MNRTRALRALAGAFLIMGGLGGCSTGGIGAALSGDGRGGGAMVASSRVTFADGFVVAAPGGYCVDNRRTRQSGASGFTVLASCENLGGAPGTGVAEPGLITVSISPGSIGAPGTLAELAQTTAGRARLSRSGQADSVQVHTTATSSRAVYVNLTDRSPGGAGGLDPRHWKAAFDAAGRVVVVSVYGADGSDLLTGGGEDLARDAAQTLIDANAATPAPVAPASVVEIAANSPDTTSSNTPSGLASALGGLFSRR
ncbi:MAG: hypothetical protein AAFO93_03285 [Pseudomonadota bacterium]